MTTPDPRLEIPEVLRTPVRQPTIDPVTGNPFSGGPKGGASIDTAGMGKAWAIGMDFVFTLIAGVLLGWGADYLFKSAPIGILAGVAFGFAAGLTRMIRAANRQNRKKK